MKSANSVTAAWQCSTLRLRKRSPLLREGGVDAT